MKRSASAGAAGLLIAVACAAATGTAAQIGGTSRTGNPTPGTPQPDPPNLANRITLVGCVQRSTADTTNDQKVSQDTLSDSRYVLTNVTRRRVVPVGTGGSKLTKGQASRTYKLNAIESQLLPFLGGKVEISGELRPRPPSERTNPPTVQVEFVQRLGATCP